MNKIVFIFNLLYKLINCTLDVLIHNIYHHNITSIGVASQIGAIIIFKCHLVKQIQVKKCYINLFLSMNPVTKYAFKFIFVLMKYVSKYYS